MEEHDVSRGLRPVGAIEGGISKPGWLDLARLREDLALHDALLAAGCCLLIVFISGTVAFLIWGASGDLTGVLDPPGLVEHLGSSLQDTLAAPFARWDSAWYLLAAEHGYGPTIRGVMPTTATASFFPLYPLLVAAVGALGPGVLLAGIIVSVVSLVVGLRWVWMLTRAEFGDTYPETPRLTVYLIALFPTAFFLTAVYPESLMLATSAGAFWMARNGRWAWAGVLGGLGAADHSLGLLIVVPLGLFYLREHHWRLKWDVLWLALVPAGYAAFMAYLGLLGFDPLWPTYAHEQWLRFFVGPFSGTWEAIRAAVAGVQQIASGQSAHVYWAPAVAYGYSPMTAATDNLELFGFLVLAVVATIGALRRLPLAYGAYVAVALLVTVSYPIEAQPLAGLSRYVAVLFPVQMVIARWLAIHARWRIPVLALSAAGLVFYTGYFATWHFVA
jgi:hypothetical protein